MSGQESSDEFSVPQSVERGVEVEVIVDGLGCGWTVYKGIDDGGFERYRFGFK
ncbi:BQ5605_C013g07139 [Microbotryum silenes-dioicae]|uniref:BQ5605_C013g07139 protein n=1 Tax=Microbotryum silenes-dioicae TaxID=796604 RepID=A0A2X0LVN4_9BASI|nr:BQ5605_C013g07139 [Microbotryum silenes-dioicae]